MQICAKESQQRTWETVNIHEKSAHKSKGRGIYGTFFGDFSRCSLLSVSISQTIKSPPPSVISSTNRSSAGHGVGRYPGVKMRDWLLTSPAPRGRGDALNQTQPGTGRVRLVPGQRFGTVPGGGKSLSSANVHGPFCTRGTVVASQRWGQVRPRSPRSQGTYHSSVPARGPEPSVAVLL